MTKTKKNSKAPKMETKGRGKSILSRHVLIVAAINYLILNVALWGLQEYTGKSLLQNAKQVVSSEALDATVNNSTVA